MNRRKLLKRIGGASALPLAAGTAAASGNDDEDTTVLRVKFPETDEVVSIEDHCICEDGCAGCDCPCSACAC